MKSLITSILLLLFPILVHAQFSTPGYRAEAGTIIKAGSQKPFWLISNRDGRYHPDRSAVFGGLYLGSELKRQNDLYYHPEDTTGELTIDYGLELYNRYNGVYDFQLNQYYAKASWWYFNLQVGARAESFGNQYDPLSSGSLLYSRNGRPIPRVSVSSDYIPVPLTRGYIEFRGHLSHGWFEKDRYTESPFLHHKNVYVRVGGDLPVQAHYGFHHYAMWGGFSPDYGQVEEGWEGFWKVFFVDQGEYIPGEIKNRYGNHLGSRNFGLNYKGEELSLNLYWQTIFEDNSGKAWRNIRDGLWGLVYKNQEYDKPFLKSAIFEYLHTTDQSGPYHRIDGEIVGGNDNYFNHDVIYHDGWTSKEYIIGTPLITSPVIKETRYATSNNKVIAYHLGMEGWFNNNLRYRTMLSYSLNYGTNDNPFVKVKREFSVLTEFQYQIPDHPTWMIKTALAGDLGSMYGPDFGLMVSVVKRSGVW